MSSMGFRNTISYTMFSYGHLGFKEKIKNYLQKRLNHFHKTDRLVVFPEYSRILFKDKCTLTPNESRRNTCTHTVKCSSLHGNFVTHMSARN